MTGAVYLHDKGIGVTSRKAAGEAARALGFKKYGHCGTLDPDATGLLVVLLGRATRLARYLSGDSKRYSFILVTGISTDTLDTSGTVTERADSSHVSSTMIKEALKTVTGTVRQQVPLVSAVRISGIRGYKLARQGKTPEMPVRTVTVSNWNTGEITDGRIPMEVTVSAGTYVRALARDIGKALGVPAVADSIRRTASGVFTAGEASVGFDDPGSLLTMAHAVGRVMNTVSLSPEDSIRVAHGMTVSGVEHGEVALQDPEGRLMAIGLGDGTAINPKTVLVTPEEL